MEKFPFKIKLIIPEDPEVRTNMIYNYVVYHGYNLIRSSQILALAESCKPDISVIIKRLYTFKVGVDFFSFCEIVNRMKDFGFLSNNDIIVLSEEANKVLQDKCHYMDVSDTPKLYTKINTVRTKN